MDDALLKLAMPEGKYALQITLLTPGNRPIPNVAITGITTITGGAVTTDANGKSFGFATSNPVIVTADLSKFLDLTDNISQSFSLTSGIVNQGVMTASRSSETQKLLTSSGSFYFSPDVAQYDWSAIGGGYNGENGEFSEDSLGGSTIITGGSGGNAGGVINQANVISNNNAIAIVVGAVGGGKSSVNGTETPDGVNGGIGARWHYQLAGRAATNGGSTAAFLYPPTSVGGAGGGGGEIWTVSGISSSDHPDAGSGGSPGGGSGGYFYTYQGTDSDGGIVNMVGYDKINGSNGLYYGSGGGGGASSRDRYYRGSGGSGKQGVVGFMWRFKS